MYERPVPTDKAPGPFVTLSLGLALPNFNWSDIRTDSDFGDHLPFDPDIGTMAGLKIGMLPLPWLGGGVNLNFGGTFATNRYDMILIADNPDDYRYYGYKAFGHIGGFVRLQYPFRRVVPFIDIAAGYSAVRYRWTVYDASTSWSDIEEDWDSGRTDSSVDRDKRTVTDGHFTLALEPGVDVFVLERRFAVGARGWLPIVASSHRGMDNIGLMFTATFTPQWAEPLQRKQEYQQ
jgi:hypothetical protein